MKYVYVLTSSERDYYCEECIVSMISLLKQNPDAHIVLLIDDKTQRNLKGSRAKVKNLATEVIVHAYDENIKQKVRSRLLKTSSRQLIKGDFLFIDTDTVISEALEDISDFKCDLGMVLDKHVTASKHYMYMFIPMYANAAKMGYSVGYNDCHFNSGVMLVRDTQKTHDFFKLWNELYKETLLKGIDIDQLSLNEANCRMGGIITELPGIWNMQVNYGVKYIAYAKIIHYLGFQPYNKQAKYFTLLPFELCDAQYFEEMKKIGSITKEISQIIENPKSAFALAVIVPESCSTYKLIFSNHMRVLKFLYVDLKSIYNFFESIYGFLFKMIFKRV